jgi:hypothetical protein
MQKSLDTFFRTTPMSMVMWRGACMLRRAGAPQRDRALRTWRITAAFNSAPSISPHDSKEIRMRRHARAARIAHRSLRHARCAHDGAGNQIGAAKSPATTRFIF